MSLKCNFARHQERNYSSLYAAGAFASPSLAAVLTTSANLASLFSPNLCVCPASLWQIPHCPPRLQNNRGSSGPSLEIFSSSGYLSNSGSGTFTLAPFNMLISSNAFTTPLP